MHTFVVKSATIAVNVKFLYASFIRDKENYLWFILISSSDDEPDVKSLFDLILILYILVLLFFKNLI